MMVQVTEMESYENICIVFYIVFSFLLNLSNVPFQLLTKHLGLNLYDPKRQNIFIICCLSFKEKFHHDASAHVQILIIPVACECKEFKQILLHKVGFECTHKLIISPPLNLHSYNDRVPFIGLHHVQNV